MDAPWNDAVARQFGAVQLNLLLRQTVDAAPRWVGRAAVGRTDG